MSDIEREVADAIAHVEAMHRIEALTAFIAQNPNAQIVAVAYDPDEPVYELYLTAEPVQAIGMLVMAQHDLAEIVLHGTEDEG